MLSTGRKTRAMDFDKIAFSRAQAATGLASFKTWMSTKEFFGETEAVAEIRKRRHIACLLGFTVFMPNPDLIKFELEVKGLFRADLAIGNDGGRIFV